MEELSAARGGLVGGDGSPEEGTSGIPLRPCDPRSAVVDAAKVGLVIDDVAGGEDINSVSSALAPITS